VGWQDAGWTYRTAGMQRGLVEVPEGSSQHGRPPSDVRLGLGERDGRRGRASTARQWAARTCEVGGCWVDVSKGPVPRGLRTAARGGFPAHPAAGGTKQRATGRSVVLKPCTTKQGVVEYFLVVGYFMCCSAGHPPPPQSQRPTGGCTRGSFVWAPKAGNPGATVFVTVPPPGQ
jgi:hypothetical protein